MPVVREAIAQDVAVVVVSRCPAGLIYDRYGYPGAYRDLRDSGVLFAMGLNGPKARLKLMAALGAGLSGEELRCALERMP
jgi:L-asparaginase